MKYHLYNDNHSHMGCFTSIEGLRRFLCERKYNTNCDHDVTDTFDYINSIKWSFEIEE